MKYKQSLSWCREYWATMATKTTIRLTHPTMRKSRICIYFADKSKWLTRMLSYSTSLLIVAKRKKRNNKKLLHFQQIKTNLMVVKSPHSQNSGEILTTFCGRTSSHSIRSKLVKEIRKSVRLHNRMEADRGQYPSIESTRSNCLLRRLARTKTEWISAHHLVSSVSSE